MATNEWSPTVPALAIPNPSMMDLGLSGGARVPVLLTLLLLTFLLLNGEIVRVFC